MLDDFANTDHVGPALLSPMIEKSSAGRSKNLPDAVEVGTALGFSSVIVESSAVPQNL